MLRLYFGPESRFILKKWVKKYILSLLLKDLLTLEQKKSLYKVYLDSFQSSVDGKLFNDVFNWIKEAEVHGAFGNWKSAGKSLSLIDKSSSLITAKLFRGGQSMSIMINMPKMI